MKNKNTRGKRREVNILEDKVTDLSLEEILKALDNVDWEEEKLKIIAKTTGRSLSEVQYVYSELRDYDKTEEELRKHNSLGL